MGFRRGNISPISYEQRANSQRTEKENNKKAFVQELFKLFDSGETPKSIKNEMLAKLPGIDPNLNRTIPAQVNDLTMMGVEEMLDFYFDLYKEKPDPKAK